jgi:hypothetical protein
MKVIVDFQRELYGTNYRKFGPTPKGTFQNNLLTQYLRYEYLLKNLLPLKSNFTIHDVGSGICDLHKYLNELKIEHQYSGTEIVQDMIDYSVTSYPDIVIKNRDMLKVDSDKEKYDFVVLSGTLNIKGDASQKIQEDYALQLITKMYQMSGIGMSFNFLTTYKTFTDESLLYFDPKFVFDFCMTNLSRFVVLDHSYPLYEVSVTVLNYEFLKEYYNKPELVKYFK